MRIGPSDFRIAYEKKTVSNNSKPFFYGILNLGNTGHFIRPAPTTGVAFGKEHIAKSFFRKHLYG